MTLNRLLVLSILVFTGIAENNSGYMYLVCQLDEYIPLKAGQVNPMSTAVDMVGKKLSYA